MLKMDANWKSVPSVDILIPCVNEPLELIVENIRQYFRIDYPKNSFSVYLLVDSPRNDLESALSDEIRQGLKIIRRPNMRENFKAGNLNYGLFSTGSQSELILIMDCDHNPGAHILKTLVPFFLKDENNFGFVQARSYPKNIGNQDWFDSKVLGINILQGYYASQSSPICVGSCVLFKRSVLTELNGFYNSLGEDFATGMRISSRYATYFCDEFVSSCEEPTNLVGLFRQRFRWAYGIAQYMYSCLLFEKPLPFHSLKMRFSFVMYGIAALSNTVSLFTILYQLYTNPTKIPLAVMGLIPVIGILLFKVFQYYIFRSFTPYQFIAFQRFVFTLTIFMATSLIKIPFEKMFGRKTTFHVSPKNKSSHLNYSYALFIFHVLFFVSAACFLHLIWKGDFSNPIYFVLLLIPLEQLIVLAPAVYGWLFPPNSAENKSPPEIRTKNVTSHIMTFLLIPSNWSPLALIILILLRLTVLKT